MKESLTEAYVELREHEASNSNSKKLLSSLGEEGELLD